MNARRTHALSFLLNGDLQLMSSGRQTGRRLGGWGARPEEGARRRAAGPKPSLRFAGLARPRALASWERCRLGEGFRSKDPSWRLVEAGVGGGIRKNGRQRMPASTGMGLGLGVGEMECKQWGGESISAGS